MQRIFHISRFAPRLLCSLVLAILAASIAAAQPAGSEAQVESLQRVVASLQQVRKARDEKIEEIKNQPSSARQERLAVQLDELNQKISSLEDNFLIIASGIETESFREQDKVKIDWAKELEDLMSPLFQEVRRLTSRPREFARLRNDVEKHNQQLALIAEADQNISRLAKSVSNPQLAAELEAARHTWVERQNDFRTRLSIDQNRLDQLERAKKSIGESISDIFAIFFASRGRNLLVAVVIAFLFGAMFRSTHRMLESRSRGRRSRGSLPHRLLNVMSLIASTIGGFIAFLITLYVFGDWVLLIIGILFLLGVIWTSKHAIPSFVQQAILLLNIGPVREGERTVIEGVPWHVKRISLYSEFENPFLSRRFLRLPIRDLYALRSQPADIEEPWFPTRNGDWVVLADGTVGCVRGQSQEFITVVPLGGASKYYPTLQFMAQTPQVLSHGFRISIVIGLDYSLQREITTAVPERLDRAIREGLRARSFEGSLRQLSVELEEAAASSLNLRINADFSGELADRYAILHRLLTRLCVDACNANGWPIPFPQLTVHMAAQKA